MAQYNDPRPERAGMGTGLKVALGCGIGCFGLIVVGIIGSVIGYRYFMGRVDDEVAKFTEQGFVEAERALAIDVTEEITEKTVYVGQFVKVFADSETDIAILAQMAEIHGAIGGTVYFRGQMITIQPNAEIQGDLDVDYSPAIQVHGEILGEIKGEYTSLTGPSTPDAEADEEPVEEAGEVSEEEPGGADEEPAEESEEVSEEQTGQDPEEGSDEETEAEAEEPAVESPASY